MRGATCEVLHRRMSCASSAMMYSCVCYVSCDVRRGQGLSMLTKMGLGFTFSILAMVVAGEHDMLCIEMYTCMHERACIAMTSIWSAPSRVLFHVPPPSPPAILESSRLHAAHNGNLISSSVCFSDDDTQQPRAVGISIFVQAPQFIFIGLSEVLTSVTGETMFEWCCRCMSICWSIV